MLFLNGNERYLTIYNTAGGPVSLSTNGTAYGLDGAVSGFQELLTGTRYLLRGDEEHVAIPFDNRAMQGGIWRPVHVLACETEIDNGQEVLELLSPSE